MRFAFILAGSVIGSQFAQAQTQESTPVAPQMSASESAATIPDAKIDQFAAAFVAVQNIQVQASQELSAAKDDQQATAVKSTAEGRMVDAVKKQGLEVEEFNRIATLMTTDVDLRTRVAEKVQARKKG